MRLNYCFIIKIIVEKLRNYLDVFWGNVEYFGDCFLCGENFLGCIVEGEMVIFLNC